MGVNLKGTTMEEAMENLQKLPIPTVVPQPKKEYDPLVFAVTTVVEGVMARWEAGALEIQDVQELVWDLKKHGGAIGKRAAEELQGYIDNEVRRDELCPLCFAKLEPGGFIKECVGYYGNERVYQRVATRMVCENNPDLCDYSEKS